MTSEQHERLTVEQLEAENARLRERLRLAETQLTAIGAIAEMGGGR
jgi:cell shape-determining protein MreC